MHQYKDKILVRTSQIAINHNKVMGKLCSPMKMPKITEMTFPRTAYTVEGESIKKGQKVARNEYEFDSRKNKKN